MKYWIWPITLCAVLICAAFQCERIAFVELSAKNWQAHPINNAGKSPLISTDEIPRQAFGIRVGGDILDFTPATADSLDTEYSVSPRISAVDIFAVAAFDTVDAGSLLNGRFRARAADFRPVKYRPTSSAPGILNFPALPTVRDYFVDLVMVEPPEQPGDYFFSVKITFDTAQFSGSPDTLIFLPKVVLK